MDGCYEGCINLLVQFTMVATFQKEGSTLTMIGVHENGHPFN